MRYTFLIRPVFAFVNFRTNTIRMLPAGGDEEIGAILFRIFRF